LLLQICGADAGVIPDTLIGLFDESALLVQLSLWVSDSCYQEKSTIRF
jgi:hypothetical protein